MAAVSCRNRVSPDSDPLGPDSSSLTKPEAVAGVSTTARREYNIDLIASASTLELSSRLSTFCVVTRSSAVPLKSDGDESRGMTV